MRHTMSGDQYLFVYGTLRHTTGGAMQRRLLRSAQYTGCASFQGRLYLVADYPGAVPSAEPSDMVQGEVYRLLDPQPLLSELDRYEACDNTFPEPHEFVREIHQVNLHGGRSLWTWVYVYNQSIRGLRRLESGDFSRSEHTQTV